MNDDKRLTQKDETTPDENEEKLERLSEFIVSMVQAFLRTGYYTSEHPESEKARAGLYARFSDLVLKKGELSFLVKAVKEDEQVFVEGMLPEPCDLSVLMFAGMAELYDEKLREFLEKKELVSLTLKQNMEKAEFHDFIDVMSKPILTDIHDKQKRGRFLSYLQEKGIKNISFVFNEDLIRWERDIPWRAWIALSRLRKDVSLIPILRDLEREELREVKREVVSDVLRPLKDPQLSFATLVNSDLIQSELMEEEEIEADIVDCLSNDMLYGNVEEFIHRSSQLKALVGEKTYEEKLDRILNLFKKRLRQSDDSRLETCVRKLYKHGMISFDELPKNLKQEVLLKKFLETFLRDPDAVLTRLEEAQDEREYRSFVKSVSGIMPWLIEQGRFGEFQKILLILKKSASEGGEKGKHVSAVLEQIGSSDIPLKLKEKFMSGSKESRLALYPTIRHLGPCMTLPLLGAIEETRDKWVRKNAIEVLLQIGRAASSALGQALKSGRFAGEVIGDTIKAVVTSGNQEAKGELASVAFECRNHQDPYVRKHALSLLADVHRIKAEEALLHALNDSDAEVRKTVITYLGVIKSKQAIPAFEEILKNTAESDSADAELIENQIYWALGLIDNGFADGARTPEQILLEVLQQRVQTKTISRLLRRKESVLSDQATGVICESLGKVGTKLSTPVLTELAGDKKKPWADKAHKALSKIVRRF